MRRDDQGFVAGAEGVLFGFLVFVLGVFVIANGWAVIESRAAASSAAREAARTFVESSNPATAWLEAQQAGREAMSGYGRRGDDLRFVNAEPVLQRCARVEIVVEYDVPFVAVGRPAMTVTGRHAEIVDPFRSGLPDRSRC